MKIQKFSSRMMIALMLCGVGIVNAQESTSCLSAFTDSEALNMAKQWAAEVSQGNVGELEKLLNDKYMHIHATSLVESKEQFLEAFRKETRKYDPINLEDTNVRVFGCAAVVTGKFDLKAFARGKTIESVNRFSLVLVKSQDGQQVVSFQATITAN